MIHRDLKPANIKLRDDGTVKVLDFGLAKTQDRSPAPSDVTRVTDLANSPTMASPHVSQAGLILGTAAYMSPEQARGRAVDKRSDVWAFGAVLYEMLSGVRAFDGEDVTEVIAAVVKDAPDWSKLPAATPSHIASLIRKCLEKDRKSRTGDMAVVRFVLSGAGATVVSNATAPPARPWLWVAIALITGAAIGWVLHRPAAASRPVTFAQLALQPADLLTPGRSALSVAFGVCAVAGRTPLCLYGHKGKRHASLRARSRAARSIAVEGNGWRHRAVLFARRIVDWVLAGQHDHEGALLAGGPPTTVCELPPGSFWGASWKDDGLIYFASREGVFRVSASGGTPEAITKVEKGPGILST